MQVSSNTLLNILLPNNNKTLKNVLKEADTKNLEQMVQNKNSSINDVLKNLFDQVKNGNKSNATIENLLKNSNVFKDLGSFPKSLDSVIKQVDTNSSLQKYKPFLESFLKDTKNIDANLLKEQLSKSGVFLESKISQSATNNTDLPKTLEKTLGQIQNLIKDINTPQTKQINELISKILDPNIKNSDEKMANVKSLIPLLNQVKDTLLDKNTQNLSNLTNELKSLINKGSLLESKLQNNPTLEINKANLNANIIKQAEPQTTKELLGELRKELSLDNKQNSSLLTKLDTVLKSNDLFNKAENQPLMKTILTGILNSNEMTSASKINPNISNLLENIKTSMNEPIKQTAQANIQQSQINSPTSEVSKEQIQTQTKQILSQLKNEFANSMSVPTNDSKAIVEKIDNLLKNNDLFSKDTKQVEVKTLLNNLINSKDIDTASKTNQNISNIVLNLKNITQEISTLENKTLNSTNIINEKAQLTSSLKENLANLKSELANMPNIDSKAINEVITKLQNSQNLFSKVELTNNLQQNIQNNNLSTFTNNFASNLNNLLVSLKENIVNVSSNLNNVNIQNQIFNTIDKIETMIKENIQMPNNFLKNDVNQSSNDMKSVLLQMSEELASKTDQKSQELAKQVEKMLVQIDYHQLLSLTANSNYVYVPFFWDMLEDGTINMKKVDEEKFYCQINLTLKDFGKVDLMLSLYDKNKLDLSIYAQREHFKIAVKENLQKLKKALNSVELIPVNIKLLNLEEDKTEETKKTEVYVNPYNDDLNSGLNIRV